MVQINEQNKVLLQESLDMVEFEMNILRGMKQAPSTANYSGSEYADNNYGAMGSFDAKQEKGTEEYDMGMAGLYVGLSGLQTSSNSLNTTANNLANVNTSGYVRQQVVNGDKSYNFVGTTAATTTGQKGLGVSIAKINHVRDMFLDAAYRKEYGRQGF